MNLRRLSLILALAVTLSSHVHASFHLWDITEVYSNSDGSQQFVEMFSPSNGEQFISGHSLNSNNSSYEFLTNTPSGTAGKFLLIATGPIAGVNPDYVIPANFFSLTNDHVNFAGVSNLAWTTLPVMG